MIVFPNVTPRTPPTARQRQFLQAIYRHILAHGESPTFRDLMGALGIRSPNGVYTQLYSLRAKGYLTWNDSRSLRAREREPPPRGRRGGGKARSLRLVGLEMLPRITDDEQGRRLREALGMEEDHP